MFARTDLPGNIWRVVEAEDKKSALINMIPDLLGSVPYEKVERPDLDIPKRPESTGYRRTERDLQHCVDDYAAKLDASSESPWELSIPRTPTNRPPTSRNGSLPQSRRRAGPAHGALLSPRPHRLKRRLFSES